jgi:hypothetical protein
MQASDGHPLFRPRRPNSYKAYSIGCFVVWGLLLAIFTVTATSQTLHNVLIGFVGWVIGWTSASIARLVYPPPNSRGLRGR